MLKKVPTVRTTSSKGELVKAFIVAWSKLFGKLPTKNNIAVIYAHWALETGSGSACWNWNLGNVKAIDNPNEIIEYCALKNVWEIINGKKVILSVDDPGSRFRAFPTLLDGVMFYLNFLRNKRYRSSWVAVEQGDPKLFAHLLRLAGYYTATEADYVRAMQYHFSKFVNDSIFDTLVNELDNEAIQIDFPSNYESIPAVAISFDEFYNRPPPIVGSNFSMFSLPSAIFNRIFNK